MNLLRYFEILCNKSARDLFYMAGEHFGFSKSKIENDFVVFLGNGILPRYTLSLLDDFGKSLTVHEVQYCHIWSY